MHNVEKGSYAVCGQPRSRSACAAKQSNLGIFCSSTYSHIIILSRVIVHPSIQIQENNKCFKVSLQVKSS